MNDLLNKQQTSQLIDFAPNFAALLYEAGFSREQTAEALHSALACIFAAIWKLPSDRCLSDEEQAFLLAMQVRSLRMFYGQEASE